MSAVWPTPVIDTIRLPAPAWPGVSIGEAFRRRCSTRVFAPEPLPLETLSALLWAAFGINRRDRGRRTAPSAHDCREFDVFAVLSEAAYRYDAEAHALRLAKAGDLRAATGTQDFVAAAPVNLVYVADFSRMRQGGHEEQVFLASADCGCIAQNVSLFCAAAGLATVIRGLVDRRRLAAALELCPTRRIVLAQSVGRPSSPA